MNTNIVTPDTMLQWIKGDKIGNVEKVVTQDSEWTIFQGGSRISTEILNEFMIPIEGELLDSDVYDFTKSKEIKGIPILPHKTDSPIKTLFDKQKKPDQINLEFSIPVNVPPTDIFNIISISFDEEEVLKELDLFISNQVNIKEIKDTLQKSIHDLIVKRYNTQPKIEHNI